MVKFTSFQGFAARKGVARRSQRRFPARRRAGIGGFLALLLAGMPQDARANFQFCNQTLDVVNVAVGQWDVDDWESSGWWTVGPNQCANLIEHTLTARYVYVFARDVFNKAVLAGDTTMCIDPGEFRLRGGEDCLVTGHIPVEFFEVDTRRSERWTFYLSEPAR